MADGKSHKAMSEAALDATLDATEKARQDALGLAQQEEGAVTLQDGTETGKASAYRSQQDAAEAAGTAEAKATEASKAAEAAGVAQTETEGLLASTSGEGITDEWLREVVQSFTATSTTRDDAGRVDEQDGTYRDGSGGTMTLMRGEGGAVNAVAYSHAASGKTLTQTITRDAGGRYESTEIEVS